jgi:hypothetical protein
MLQFQCRKCGVSGPTLEGHKCVPVPDLPSRSEPRKTVDLDIPATAGEREARLEKARAALARVAAPVVKPEEVLAPLPKADGFDRAAYHKAYMKAYMRGWRARRKEGG